MLYTVFKFDSLPVWCLPGLVPNSGLPGSRGLQVSLGSNGYLHSLTDHLPMVSLTLSPDVQLDPALTGAMLLVGRLFFASPMPPK